MEPLNYQEEMQANRVIATEIITQRLDVTPSEKNIEKLAAFIFELEHEIN